jgi:hypothetical protein
VPWHSEFLCSAAYLLPQLQRSIPIPRVGAVAHRFLLWLTRRWAGDAVVLYVNKVGPYHNPSETYDFYDMPVCRPASIKRVSESLGKLTLI